MRTGEEEAKRKTDRERERDASRSAIGIHLFLFSLTLGEMSMVSRESREAKSRAFTDFSDSILARSKVALEAGNEMRRSIAESERFRVEKRSRLIKA